MLFLNQNDYPHIPYPTDTEHPDSKSMLEGTIKSSGCGLCCCCMVVDRLTLETLPLETALQMSIDSGANHEPGTDMMILGPVVAKKYGLEMTVSDNMGELIDCLRSGGCAILNPGGDREGHDGLFTYGGHYITAISYHKGEILILDPSWDPEKFHTPEREGLVREDGCLVYATPEVIILDTENRRPRYYLFKRRTISPGQ